MEDTTVGTSEANNVDSSMKESPPKETNELGADSASEPNSEKTNDKVLSWEKIAAEIAAEDGENQTQLNEEVKEALAETDLSVSKVEDHVDETTVKETVINTVTVEKIVTAEKTVTEPDTSEVIPDSTQEKPEEVQQPQETAPPADSTKEPDSVGDQLEEASVVEEEVPVMQEPPVVEEAAPVVEGAAPVVEEFVPPTEVVEAPPEAPIVEAPPEAPIVEEAEETQVVEPEQPERYEQHKEAKIEISEVKPEEVSEVPAEDLEYTVVEAEEVETNEIIEEHLAQSSNRTKCTTETVVIINPDESQTEITIEQVEDDDRTDENSQSYTEEIYLVSKDSEGDADDPGPESPDKPIKPKKQRGRKPISDIPLHVLGRDITKPTEGVSNGGRTMPKPRLGVKVPYRNLTSQIVSKQEIEKEIMERFKLKQEQTVTNSGDILFARKLTQRLAKKLIPSEKEKDKSGTKDQDQEPSSSTEEDKASEIKNNSDLIAILEGDGDEIDLKKQKQAVEVKEVKKTEREIALEQLKELPGKPKPVKEEKKVPSPQKEVPKVKETLPPKPNTDKKNQMDVEPRLKTGMVIKTYTRKRKSTEMEPLPPPKKTVVTTTTVKTEDGSPGTVYITKSSRVIKRKVIWDPDEVPVKSPLKSPKLESIKLAEKKEPEKVQEKKTVPSPVKKIIAKGSPLKKFKRLTEIDKLLMDEGAVNMLYDVKTNEEASPEKKKKTNKSVISLDKAHKELMSKTNVIKNDLQQHTNTVQKTLRKKEIVSPPSKKEAKKETTPSAVTRKKSKDSARSSPPASPPYNAAEASRIIRRHSSSSFSSNDEFDEESGEEKLPKKKAASGESSKKKAKKSGEAKPVKETTKNNNNTVAETKTNHVDKTKIGQFKSFTATKKNKLVAIKLQSVDGKCYLNEQVLKELTTCLKDLGKDDDCHVVAITSDNNESFCEGLDYRLLVVEDESGRKKKANELASLVKEFLRCLLNFPKVLVAGIQGDCVGLGVTMLPLFDMVVASDTSTFSTPYSRLGCIPEAGFLLTVPHLSNNGLASELFYTAQTIKADDAFRRGLVSRLCWPEKYTQELKSILSQVSTQPRQCIVATKQQLRQNILETTESALSSVSKNLVEYWTSPECQKNFAK